MLGVLGGTRGSGSPGRPAYPQPPRVDPGMDPGLDPGLDPPGDPPGDPQGLWGYGVGGPPEGPSELPGFFPGDPKPTLNQWWVVLPGCYISVLGYNATWGAWGSPSTWGGIVVVVRHGSP